MSFSRVAVWRLGRALTSGTRRAALSMPGPPQGCARTIISSSKLLTDTAVETKETEHSNADSKSSQQSNILQASLQYVPEFGWTPSALKEGIRSLDLPLSSHEIFPRGGGELIDYFEQQCNLQLMDYMKPLMDTEQTSKLIRSSLELRLRMLEPYMEKWLQAMALKAFPLNTPSSLENLAIMVDDIWYCAGDRSTDTNWYTKRAILAAVYSTTELHMVQDDSVDYQDTWDFLDRRLEDTANFSKARQQVENSLSVAMERFSAGTTTARNMLGLNCHDR